MSLSEIDASAGPTAKLDTLLSAVKSTAVDIVGTVGPQQRPNHSNDSMLVKLVDKRRDLRLHQNTNGTADRSGIKSQINRTQKAIQHRLRDIKSQAAEYLASTIALTDVARQ